VAAKIAGRDSIQEIMSLSILLYAFLFRRKVVTSDDLAHSLKRQVTDLNGILLRNGNAAKLLTDAFDSNFRVVVNCCFQIQRSNSSSSHRGTTKYSRHHTRRPWTNTWRSTTTTPQSSKSQTRTTTKPCSSTKWPLAVSIAISPRGPGSVVVRALEWT